MLADLYSQHSAALTARIAAALGGHSDVEDLAQDVWLWAIEQDQLPSSEDLFDTADSLIVTEQLRQTAEPELAGLRHHPDAQPLTPVSTYTEIIASPVQFLVGVPRSGKSSYARHIELQRLAAA